MQTIKNIKILYWFNFFTDFKLYAPVAIIYFSSITGSYTLGMSIFSVVMISAALFEIPTGIFSDIIGRKKTIVLGALSIFIGAIFYALGTHYWILIIGAIFEGLSRSFYSGNNDALLHDSLTDAGQTEKYHHYLGKISSMFQIAAGLAALLGGLVAAKSFAWVMWLSVLSQLICVILAVQLIEPTTREKKSSNIYIHLKESFKNFISNKKLRALSLASILGFGMGEASFQFQSAFIQTVWPVWAIGISKMLSNVGAAFSYFYSGRLIDKFKPLKILIASHIYSRFINTVAFLFPTSVSPILIPTTSLFFGVSDVSKNSLLQHEFTEQQRATMGSLNSLAGSLFFGLFGLVLGATADKIGPAQALVWVQGAQLIILWLYWRLFHQEKTTSKK